MLTPRFASAECIAAPPSFLELCNAFARPSSRFASAWSGGPRLGLRCAQAQALAWCCAPVVPRGPNFDEGGLRFAVVVLIKFVHKAFLPESYKDDKRLLGRPIGL